MLVVLCLISLITEITIQPIRSITVIALKSVMLNCSASIDDVRYSWHRVDGHIPSHSKGQHNNTFTIHRVTPNNQGTYYCIANKHGIVVKSSDASVQVDGKNVISYSITLKYYVACMCYNYNAYNLLVVTRFQRLL